MLYKLLYKISMVISKYLCAITQSSIEVNGYKITYLKSKKFLNKETVFFIHGLNDQKESWLSLIKRVKGKNIIAIDLLGSGNSDKPFNFDYSINSQANFTKDIIEKIAKANGVKKLSIAGHSMGGGIALILANKISLENLYLFAPYGIDAKDSVLKKRALKNNLGKNIWKNICTINKLNNLLADLYYNIPNFPNFLLNYLVEKKCKNRELESIKIDALVDNNLNIKTNLAPIAKDIKVNTLIFWGKKDYVIDVASAYEFNKLIKDSKLITYNNCGHMVQIEKAKEIAKEI